MYEGITSLLNEAAKDDRVVVTALTGAKDFYSSGNDMASAIQYQSGENSSASKKTGVARVREMVSAFINYPKVLVAVVNGPAIGIAATILGLCDVVYASDKAYFHTPFTKLGLVAEGCSSYLFPRIMGISKASEMLYFGRQMCAHDAMECGLVSKVFPHAIFEKEVWPKLEELAEMPKESMFASKRLVRNRLKEDLHKANEEECKELEIRMQSEECMNAVIQFLSRKSKM
ncbi:hypothetical protein L9F63_004069 [Diploptera punctata]|uniref:Enoyl-CoA delta isomerase 2, mitochondrial n=1 Tax=Diploptera punctata TaxID=6984 RepID=A0AAD8E7Z8_DIPPU|nr:hypothetical protein L9F63_004069 [Diploptera punctata]